jgi:hypothetical protein
MTITTIFPATLPFRVGASFMTGHMTITLPLLKAFPQNLKVFSIGLEAVKNDIVEFFTTDLQVQTGGDT